MDPTDIIVPIISVFLGGGLFLGIAALKKAFTEGKEIESRSKSVDAKTPAEVESVSVATMSKALEAAQAQIEALVAERISDREYYQERIADLTGQLKSVRQELVTMEQKMRDLVVELEHKVEKEIT